VGDHVANAIAGHTVRMRHAISHLRSALDAAEIALGSAPPLGSDLAQMIASGGADVAMHIARIDALWHAREGVERG
jgi:hypothetical protein